MLLGVNTGENNNFMFTSSIFFCQFITSAELGNSLINCWYIVLAAKRFPLFKACAALTESPDKEVILVPLICQGRLILFVTKPIKTNNTIKIISVPNNLLFTKPPF
jgi:hypothetical protein